MGWTGKMRKHTMKDIQHGQGRVGLWQYDLTGFQNKENMKNAQL